MKVPAVELDDAREVGVAADDRSVRSSADRLGRGAEGVVGISPNAARPVVDEPFGGLGLSLAAVAAVPRRLGPVPQRLRSLVEVTAAHYGEDELLHASLLGETEFVDGEVSRRAAAIQRIRIRALLAEVLRAGQSEGTVRGALDADTAASVLFEIGWAIVRAELEGTADVPLDDAVPGPRWQLTNDAASDLRLLGTPPGTRTPNLRIERT